MFVFSSQVRAKVSKAAVGKNPLITFNYPSSKYDGYLLSRRVWLISSNATHFTGLEQKAGGKGGGTKYQYKKFLCAKATDFRLLSFNPEAMS